MAQPSRTKRDGKISVHLSEDAMRADVSLIPPMNGGEAFTIFSVLSALERAGVTRGIDHKGLEKVIFQCLNDEKTISAFPAALGRLPKDSVPAHWQLKKRLLGEDETDLTSPKVDYRRKSPFILVKKGEGLARSIPAAPGDPGFNVRGDFLSGGENTVPNYFPGENIIEKNNILYAAVSGRFDIENRVISVNETLDIDGDVDYSTGHIAFPGDVIIRGAVSDGFRVAAGKSIFAKQTLDASEVFCRGDLVVDGGLIGRGEGMIRIGGRLGARFIENCSIRTQGEVAVEKSVMHSTIFTQGLFDLGEKGVLVGGLLWARDGVRTGSIGRPDAPPATIRAGSDFRVDQKLRSIRAQMERLEGKIDALRSRHRTGADVEALIHQADEALDRMRESEHECRRELNPMQSACIEVFGTVDAGTAIQICEASTVLSAPMKNVVFYYDEAEDRISIRTAAGAPPGGTPDSPEQDAPRPLKPSAAAESGEKSVPKSSTVRRTEGERGEGPRNTPKSPEPAEQ